MGKDAKYKYKVNQELLKEFFTADDKKVRVTDKHLEEVKKVFTIVFIIHFNAYFRLKDDLWHDALLAITTRREKYNPKYSAYNYIYTVFRNEVGNNIKKYTRELLAEDTKVPKEELQDEVDVDIPACVKRFQEYLTGEKQFNYVRVPKADALPILLWLKSHEAHPPSVPDYVAGNTKLIPYLYKLVDEFIYE